MPPEKRMMNFELVLQDEMAREFGAKDGAFMLDHMKIIENFGVQSETSGMRITFESLPLLGEGCLLEALGEIFKTNGECERVFRAFKRAKEAHLKNGGRQAAAWHECALAYRGRCEDAAKECIAKKLMAKGKIPPMKKQPGDRFLTRNGIGKA